MSVQIFQQSTKTPLFGPYRVDPNHHSCMSNLTSLAGNILVTKTCRTISSVPSVTVAAAEFFTHDTAPATYLKILAVPAKAGRNVKCHLAFQSNAPADPFDKKVTLGIQFGYLTEYREWNYTYTLHFMCT